MHLTDGELRAYYDQALPGGAQEQARTHLSGCDACRKRADLLAANTRQVEARMAALAPDPDENRRSTAFARERLRARLLEKEKMTMMQKIFARPYRPAWAALAIIAILAVSLAFQPVRALATSFLGLFRVQEFTVVQVNPGKLPEQLGSSSQFEQLLSDDVQVEELGEPEEAASAAEASSLAGIPVRLPSDLEGDPQLVVQPGTRVSFDIDLPRIRTLLAEIGREDIELPEALDGENVTLELPNVVVAGYGDCEFDSEAAREAGYDPDSPTPRLPNCTTLMQMPSPEISAPPGLDIATIGESFLQLMGMTPEEAAQFSQNIDWTTTLVIPIPRYGTSYEDVQVDGTTGTLILQALENHQRQFLLIWVKDGLVYALTGPGDSSTALAIANSLK